jgi:hypothetical protein
MILTTVNYPHILLRSVKLHFLCASLGESKTQRKLVLPLRGGAAMLCG